MGGRAFQPTEPARRRAARANLLALLGFTGLAALVPLARAGLSGHSTGLVVQVAAASLAGVSAWLVWRRVDVGLARKRAALRRWGWLLLATAAWPVLPGAALVAAAWTALGFARLRPLAVPFLLPFAAWLLRDAALLITHFMSGGV